MTLRFSNVYGNESDILDRVIPRFVLKALSGDCLEIHGGNQIFDFTHIDDTVNGIAKSIEYISDGGWISDSQDYALVKYEQIKCSEKLQGDFDQNCIVDYNDLVVITSDWLKEI